MFVYESMHERLAPLVTIHEAISWMEPAIEAQQKFVAERPWFYYRDTHDGISRHLGLAAIEWQEYLAEVNSLRQFPRPERTNGHLQNVKSELADVVVFLATSPALGVLELSSVSEKDDWLQMSRRAHRAANGFGFDVVHQAVEVIETKNTVNYPAELYGLKIGELIPETLMGLGYHLGVQASKAMRKTEPDGLNLLTPEVLAEHGYLPAMAEDPHWLFTFFQRVLCKYQPNLVPRLHEWMEI